MKPEGVLLITCVFWVVAYLGASGSRTGVITIKSVSVESLGPKQSAKASVVVRTSRDMPVYVYWSDVTTWLPAEGHPNYTISEKAWEVVSSKKEYVMLQSTIEIKQVLLEQLSYYYDYTREHLVYYLPMTADIRSGNGQFIYHQAFDIPEKQASQNFSQTRFRLIDKPDESVWFRDGEEVELRWRFLSRDENEFTFWRTAMYGPTDNNDLDYTDEILYAEDFANTFPDKIRKFDHINVTKNVHFIGRLYLVTFSVRIRPVAAVDEGLYVLFLKSRKSLSWEKALNLRLSTRLMRNNATSLLGQKVALALSFCDGSDVKTVDGVAYFGLKENVENCIKCEAYGNYARDLVLTKDRYLVRPSSTNALVHSRYYPETKSISYTFREESENDVGRYHCRAVLKNNDVVSRGFEVAWTKPLILEAKILRVNQSEALIRCTASAEPLPELTVSRCEGEVYCSLEKIQNGPKYDITSSEDQATKTVTVTVAITMPAAELKREAIMCRATNKFDFHEDWLLFDDQITIEEAQPKEISNPKVDDGPPAANNGAAGFNTENEITGKEGAKEDEEDKTTKSEKEKIEMPYHPLNGRTQSGGFETDTVADEQKPEFITNVEGRESSASGFIVQNQEDLGEMEGSGDADGDELLAVAAI